MRTDLAEGSDRDIEGIFYLAVPDLREDTAEDILSTVKTLGKAALPLLKQAAPAIASGAASGSALGPWGALVGAGAGLASSLAKKQTRSPPVTGAPSGATAQPSPPAPAPTANAGLSTATQTGPADVSQFSAETPHLPVGPAAAAAFVSLIQNETVLLALLSQVLGNSGSQFILAPSAQNLPRASINNLLVQLLCSAAEGLPEANAASDDAYLRNEAGAYLVDPASMDQQAALVFKHIHADSEEPRETVFPSNPSFAALFLDAESVGFF